MVSCAQVESKWDFECALLENYVRSSVFETMDDKLWQYRGPTQLPR
jgi:hypothetical protein